MPFFNNWGIEMLVTQVRFIFLSLFSNEKLNKSLARGLLNFSSVKIVVSLRAKMSEPDIILLEFEILSKFICCKFFPV